MNLTPIARTALLMSCLLVASVSTSPANPMHNASLLLGATLPSANGACVWEGGSGLLPQCQQEDCTKDGGMAECTEPEIVPPFNRPASDADGDSYIYSLCDEAGPYMYRVAAWCEAAGGDWIVTPTLDCINLPGVVVGGAGTMLKDEAAMIPISTDFETRIQNPCSSLTIDEAGWGAGGTSLHCWNNPTVIKNGFILSDRKHADFSSEAYRSGDTCVTAHSEERVYMRRDRDLVCPAGYKTRTRADQRVECYRTMAGLCPTYGNPVSPISGAKLQTESDYRAGGIGGLEFTRYYNSQGYFRLSTESRMEQPMGHLWRHTYQRSLHLYDVQTHALGVAHRPNGFLLHFDETGKEIHNRDGAAARLTAVSNPPVAWELKLADDSVESYDASGRLLSIVTRAGLTTTMTWTSGKLTAVTDNFGRALTLAYTARGQVASVTQPDTAVIAYTYDEADRLALVTYPGAGIREYHYEDNTYFRDGLTGITDENNDRYATWSYSAGKAINSHHAGGVDNYDFYYSNGGGVVVDPRGVHRDLYFATVGGVERLTSTSQPCPTCGSGTVQSTTYDANGNVETTKDFNGNRTNYTFDATRNLETSRTEGLTSTGGTTAVTRTITRTWHSTFRLPATITEPDGNGGSRVTTFTYDSDGNLLERETTAGSLSRAWNYTYDSVGRMLTEDGPRTDVSDVTTYTYYANNASCVACRGQLHTVTNALGHVTTYADYDANGRATRVTDPNGVVTALSYHARGWPTQRTQAYGTGAAETTQTTYDDAGLVIRMTQPDGSYIDFDHDAAHRVVGETDPLGNTTQRTLDGQGNEVAYAAFDPLGVKRVASSRVYDTLGRLTKEIGAYGDTTEYGYDANNNQIAVIDPAGGMMTTSYDALNRPVKAVDAEGGIMLTGYDAANQVRTITDPNGLVTTYGYDALGNRTSLTSPDTGVTTMTVDDAGNTLTSTDARSITTTTDYDALNRPLERVSGSGGGAVTIDYEYDTGTNGKGQMTGVAGGGSTIALTYDALGRTLSSSETIGATTRAIDYQYNSGRLTNITYPGGTVASYSFDAAGRISGVDNKGTPLLSSVSYVPFGAMDGFTFSHGPVVQRHHDLAGRTDVLTTKPYSANLTTTAYEYDALSRLVRAQVSNNRDFRYGYDATGNRTSSALNSAVTSYSYVANSHRLDETTGAVAQSYDYDAVGNTVERGGNTLTYDARGRLVDHVGDSYVINALGQRVQKIVGGSATAFVYDAAGTLLGEYDDAAGSAAEYIYLNGVPVGVNAGPSPALTRYAIYADQLGTPRAIEQINIAEIVWEWSITGAPFGEDAEGPDPDDFATPLSPSAVPFATKLRFPGQYLDEESGLHYNYFRDYDPVIGRYAESDPIGLSGGATTYSYAMTNPVRLIDPFGLMVCQKKWTLITWYCDVGPGSDWPEMKRRSSRRVGSGDAAMANGSDRSTGSGPRPYNYGCKVKVYNLLIEDVRDYERTIHDTGAGWNWTHHDVPADQWVDIWVPECSRARRLGKQWRLVEVCCDPCRNRP